MRLEQEGTHTKARTKDYRKVWTWQIFSIEASVVKDTANPFSHHVMASSNWFSWAHALAPNKKEKLNSA